MVNFQLVIQVTIVYFGKRRSPIYVFLMTQGDTGFSGDRGVGSFGSNVSEMALHLNVFSAS